MIKERLNHFATGETIASTCGFKWSTIKIILKNPALIFRFSSTQNASLGLSDLQ